MNIAVAALNSQSSAVSAISNNLSNSSTTGYKCTTASFASMVSGSGSNNNFTGAGVTCDPTQSLTTQGTLIGSENATNLGIDGDGFFAVADSANSDIFYYTRAGDFTTDVDGYLSNTAGWYLQGYPTNQNGEVTGSESAAGLEAINVNKISGTAKETSSLTIQAVLPADAEIGDVFSVDTEIFDSLGVSHSVTLNYEKSAANEWQLTVGDPVSSTDATATTGTSTLTAGSPATLKFDPDGTLLTPETLDLSITGWSTGAADSAITYNVGSVGKTDGISQYGTTDSGSTPDIVLKQVVQDGLRFGEYTSASITADGTVYANFDNGVSYSIYKIPLATFANPNGLEASSGTVWSNTMYSGTPNLVDASSGAAGKINAGSLESSTVDTANEFSKLIVAQQAYSAASEIISSVGDMYDDLMAAKR